MKKKRLQDKVLQMEKKLRVKEQEVLTYKVTESTNVMSPKPHALTGVPATPKTPKVSSQISVSHRPLSVMCFQTAEPARGILKTPTTPMNRKHVMFHDESSDTDASAVDVMVIDVSCCNSAGGGKLQLNCRI